MWPLLEVGLLSVLAQVVLLRELNVALYGVELVYLLAVGAWLLATAVGALAGRWPRRVSADAFDMAMGAVAVALALGLVVVRGGRLLFTSAIPGAYLPLPQQILLLVLAVAPSSALLGTLFQWAARRYIDRGGTLAGAYAVESAGGLVGGVSATLAFWLGAQNLFVTAACVLLALGTALVSMSERHASRAGRVVAIAVLGLLVTFPKWPDLDRRLTRWTHPDALDARDLAYGRVTMTTAGGQVSVFQNDALWFDTEDAANETFAHLVMLQHPDPARVLLLGGGMEGLAHAALEHGPRFIRDVEIDRRMFDMIRPHLAEATRRSLADPRVQMTFTDPRRVLPSRERYDVILIAAPEPSSASANRYYTREFFASCAESLNDGGVVGFRLHSAENFWTPQLARRTASISRALRSAFPHVVVLPGTVNVFVASAAPLAPEPALLAERLERRHVRAQLVSAPYLEYLYSNDRRTEISHVLDTTTAQENADAQPICFEYASLGWLSKFYPDLATIELPSLAVGESLRTRIEWVSAGVLLLILCLTRLVSRGRRVLLVAVAGLAGMVLESVLILHFQMKNGVVFQDIGILLMGFMAGLAAGALFVDRLAASQSQWHRVRSRPAGAMLLAGLATLAVVVGSAAERGLGGGLVAVTALLALSGALVSAVFAWVSVTSASDQNRIVSPLYAGDLLGGALGSLVGSLVLIPAIGLADSARWMAALVTLALLLL
jgi:spermidine synthase